MAKNTDDRRNTNELVTSSNLVAVGTVIVGNIGSQGNIRVEGTVEGSLDSQQKIIIGESAKVNGDVKAADVEISGQVNGDIHCEESLFLKKTALIIGDIYTKKLIIENGAEFNGKCNMGTNNQLKIDREHVNPKKQASSN
ncbi:protein CcmA, bactofilin family [Cyclobacterium xiamenense]|jgi:cytoskeletal protein CcmA (bactofilin family)|uniref:Protein CcmA, bactofilin family n=1 Tax=Cyclobacterium xiamenense TaxID=1297121 RepID=A0A1H6XRL5_9BACT|nr:polymer-forming cytoskeletal protein [Cyclobacterium xiamenense]SEJ31693.1 protein CcmA, bactofilin family [Cyclobacterium xiamenense]